MKSHTPQESLDILYVTIGTPRCELLLEELQHLVDCGATILTWQFYVRSKHSVHVNMCKIDYFHHDANRVLYRRVQVTTREIENDCYKCYRCVVS